MYSVIYKRVFTPLRELPTQIIEAIDHFSNSTMVLLIYKNAWAFSINIKLWYGRASRFDSFVPGCLNQSRVSLLSSSSTYYWLASNICESDTCGSRLKEPSAITSHIYIVKPNRFLTKLPRWIGDQSRLTIMRARNQLSWNISSYIILQTRDQYFDFNLLC